MSPGSGWVRPAMSCGAVPQLAEPARPPLPSWARCVPEGLFKRIQQAYDNDCRRLQTDEDIEVRP